MTIGAALRRAIAAARAPDVDEPAGGMPWSAIYPEAPPPAIARPATRPAPFRRVASSTSPVDLAIPNPDRLTLTIVNDSTAVLYVKHGPGASTSAGGYTVQVNAGGTYILEPPATYGGLLTGVWAAANGAASVTEL